jgi:choice-of-anchor B domain-containing protein
VALAFLAACGGGTPGGPEAVSGDPASNLDRDDAGRLRMTLLAHLDAASLASQPVHAHHDEPIVVDGAFSGAGNWGYTAPDGRRFALTGISAGLSIVEVTDPSRPHNVGLIEGPANQWREVKTYGHYAYVSTEALHGIDIVDLSDPGFPRLVRTWTRTLRSAHTLAVDAERGLLYVNGAEGRTGGMRVLDIGRNPEDPREVGRWDGFYVHDSYARGDVLYASAIYDGFLALLDVRDPAQIREITRFATGGRFTHNSWLTRDGRYLFTTDERDGFPLEGWDLLNPMAPRKVSQYLARATSIAHNVMTDGDRLLVAHYTEGVHLLDVSNPEQPRLLGYYDTFTGSSGGYRGVWGAYVFPGTNLILASDINNGLFVLRYDGP